MTAEFPLAVHGLVYLLHTNRLTTSTELANNICTNPARVRKVMAMLHRANLIQAGRGKGSGYCCMQHTGAVTLKRVLLALHEEPISMNWRSGDMDQECLISSGMGALMDGIYQHLNGQCMDYLDEVTIADLCNQIFEQKETEQ